MNFEIVKTTAVQTEELLDKTTKNKIKSKGPKIYIRKRVGCNNI